MKRLILHYGFIVPVVLFLSHQTMVFRFDYQNIWLDSYLDPFCFGAIALHLTSLERQWLFSATTFSLEEILGVTCCLAFISEGLFPLLSDRFTADWFDVLAIGSGALWFCLTTGKFRKPAPVSPNPRSA